MCEDFATMENKTMTAVLLSLMAVAGLAATDAYAQSNSQRIAAIDARTSDIEDTADDISDSVGSLTTMVTAVQTALANLAAAIQDMTDSISGVQSSVDGMAGDIYQISSKISDMDSAAAGIAALDDRMAGMEGQLATLQVSVDEIDAGGDATTARDLADINSRLAGVDSRLAGMDSRLATTNSHISEALARLSNIEAALQITNQKIDRPTVVAPPPPTNALRDGETELDVNTHHYLRHGDATTDRGPAYYELAMAFSCNKNVFLDTVDLVPVLNIGDRLDHVGVSSDNDPNDDGNTLPDAGDGKPVAATNNNYVNVDGRYLYNNAFHTGANTFAELDVPLQFNNKLLRAGETLRFTSVLYDGLFRTVVDDPSIQYLGQLYPYGETSGSENRTKFTQLVDGSTRDANTPLYEINVEWVAPEAGAICSLNFAGAGTAPGLTVTQTLTYGVTADKADADNALKDYRDTMDCSGDPIEIREIAAGTTDTWRLANFAEVVLTVGSVEHTIKFDNTVDIPVLANQGDVLPLYVGYEDLVISGSMAVENLLLSIKYDTIPDASCVAVPYELYR